MQNQDQYNIRITEKDIQKRIKQLAKYINLDFKGKELIIISVMNGSFMFVADLVRKLKIDHELHFITVSSYNEGTSSSTVQLNNWVEIDIKNKYVLLIDDVLDTGNTLRFIISKLKLGLPKEIYTCVLLFKENSLDEGTNLKYYGFQIPNVFVAGYGLDYAYKYRNFPFIFDLNILQK